jgi:hypothetical protein
MRIAFDGLAHHAGAVVAVYGGVGIAVEDDGRGAGKQPGVRQHVRVDAIAHGQHRAGAVRRAAVRQAGMAAYRAEQVGVGPPHNDGHRRPRRQAGNGDTRPLDRIFGGDILREPRNQCRLAFAAPVVIRVVPVPAFVPVCVGSLLGIQHQELELFGQLVHAGTECKVAGVLSTAMEHHDQRHRLAAVTAGHKELVVHRPVIGIEASRDELAGVLDAGS